MTIERLAAYIIVGNFLLGMLGFLVFTSLELLLVGAFGACVAFLAHYYHTYWRHTGFDLADAPR